MSYLEEVFRHVATEVFQQRDFLGETFWKLLDGMKMFQTIAFDVLNIPVNKNK